MPVIQDVTSITSKELLWKQEMDKSEFQQFPLEEAKTRRHLLTWYQGFKVCMRIQAK